MKNHFLSPENVQRVTANNRFIMQTRGTIVSIMSSLIENTTYISSKVSFDGDISATQNVVIHGKMRGKIRATKHVCLGGMACFEGVIECETATISGSVTGSVLASKNIKVCVPAIVTGDLTSVSVQLEPGVVMRGKIISVPYSRPIEPVEVKR